MGKFGLKIWMESLAKDMERSLFLSKTRTRKKRRVLERRENGHLSGMFWKNKFFFWMVMDSRSLWKRGEQE